MIGTISIVNPVRNADFVAVVSIIPIAWIPKEAQLIVPAIIPIFSCSFVTWRSLGYKGRNRELLSSIERPYKIGGIVCVIILVAMKVVPQNIVVSINSISEILDFFAILE